jgi:hypothetical protein
MLTQRFHDARSVIKLPFSREHCSSYNDLVEMVRRNLLMGDWFDEDHKESLLYNGSAADRKWASQLLGNVR